DRLVWQDLDSSRLSAGQLTALRGWVAGGGRLVIVGGTAGPAALSAFPDALLPYRPDATIDVPRTTIATLAPGLPTAGADVPGLSGQLSEGTVLAAVGDRPVAAERPYGSGSVTLVGIDPTASWITESKASDILWRRLLPSRSVGTLSFGDDSQIIGAVANLPSLALPPLTGLLALLGAYILLIGPINYLVLRRLDRREWAWVTMPVLIVAFAAGAYVFGSTLRGSEVIVNEVAIVRGAPGATDGTAQSYLGVFSPSRGTYQLEVPGGALLSSPINADFFGGGIASTDIDVVQGDPARVRDLAVSFGSMRAIRAESAVTVPLIRTDLRLEGGRLKGTITNASTVQLEKPALVLGSSVVKLSDLTPGQVVTVDAAPDGTFQGLSLADRIVGQVFGDGTFVAEQSRAMFIRQAVVNQLTFDPNVGSTNQLPADGPVLLAWGSDSVLDVRIAGQKARRTGTVLYYLPTDLKVSGRTTFRNDLIRSTVVATDAAFFTKDPFTVSFGKGSATVTYRPIAMNGRLDATELVIGMNFGGDIGPGNGLPGRRLDPLPSVPPACGQDGAPGCGQGIVDGMPELELFDRVAGTWRRFPHIAAGTSGTIPSPTRYVDPETGSIQVRYVNDQSDQIGFTPAIAITGDVR
ncbi:MAG: hypothetical protein ACJ761_02860, partial [Chloroflexota bacterium]